jgi:RHS repeat-associated protein
VDRDGAVAPHAIYEASIGVSGGVPSDDTLRAYYDAAGNMAAMVVHRPDGCDLEDTTGGPDGEGCKEGADFALFFAWDEVGNLIKVQRRSPVIVENPNPPSGDCFEDENPEFFEVPSGSSFYWCVATTQASLYDFGNQRRVKLEEYEDGTPTGAPEGYSLYVSANYELRQAELAYDVYATAITSRYARDGLATSWELDSAGPGYGGGGGDPNRGRYRVTLTNHLSSVGLVLDAGTGEAMRAYSQLPYGAEEKLVATPWLESRDVGRYEFTGKERDRTVGLVYFGARYLDGRLGRWVSVDPLVLSADSGYDLNVCRYASAAPTLHIDPSGTTIYAVNAQDATVDELRHDRPRQRAILESATSTMRSPLVPKIIDWIRFAMTIQAKEVGGDLQTLADMMALFDPMTGGVGLVDDWVDRLARLDRDYGRDRLVVLHQFVAAARSSNDEGEDVAVVVALVRDDPNSHYSGWTAAEVSFGNSREGHLVIAPAGGAWSPRCGGFISEAEMVGTEIVEHAGGAAAGEGMAEYSHDAGLEWVLQNLADTEGYQPCNLYGWEAGEEALRTEGGKPADHRAFFWGMAVERSRASAPLQPRRSADDPDGGAAGGTGSD